MEFVKSFQQIPELLMDKKLPLRAVYMYSKMVMLSNKIYKREYWVTNRFSGVKELSIDSLSDMTSKLEESGLISKSKELLGKSEFPTNKYIIEAVGGYYVEVYNDYINRTDLSAEAKGLGILYCIYINRYLSMPKSVHAMAKCCGISDKTVKRYKLELERGGVLTSKGLSVECFGQNRLLAREKKSKLEFEELCGVLLCDGKCGSRRLQNQIEWLRSLDRSWSEKLYLLHYAEMGLLGKKCVEDSEEESEIRL